MTEFRNKTELPTQPGWYYARPTYDTHGRIHPTYVQKIGNTLVVLWSDVNTHDLDYYDWFGPVTEVKEG